MNILKRKIHRSSLSVKLYESLERQAREELNRAHENLLMANNEVDRVEQDYEASIGFNEDYIKSYSLCPKILGNLNANTEKKRVELQQAKEMKLEVEVNFQIINEEFIKNKAQLNLTLKEQSKLQSHLDFELSKSNDRLMSDLHNIRKGACR
jgi:hypothetical protein